MIEKQRELKEKYTVVKKQPKPQSAKNMKVEPARVNWKRAEEI